MWWVEGKGSMKYGNLLELLMISILGINIVGNMNGFREIIMEIKILRLVIM